MSMMLYKNGYGHRRCFIKWTTSRAPALSWWRCQEHSRQRRIEGWPSLLLKSEIPASVSMSSSQKTSSLSSKPTPRVLETPEALTNTCNEILRLTAEEKQTGKMVFGVLPYISYGYVPLFYFRLDKNIQIKTVCISRKLLSGMRNLMV